MGEDAFPGQDPVDDLLVLDTSDDSDKSAGSKATWVVPSR